MRPNACRRLLDTSSAFEFATINQILWPRQSWRRPVAYDTTVNQPGTKGNLESYIAGQQAPSRDVDEG